jgi:uncharacterized RDD family membrane protein YckC
MSTPPPAAPPPQDSTSAYSGYVDGTRASTIPDGVGFWPRAGARIIDTLLHVCVSVAVTVLARILFTSAPAPSVDLNTLAGRLAASSPLNFLAGYLGFVAYHTICEGMHGSTLGKLLLGQMVVDDRVQPCTLRAAFIRSLVYVVDILLFGLIGYLSMRRTRLQKRFGDHWAGTFVARRLQVPVGALRGRFGAVLALALAVDAAVVMAYIALRMR